jgi:hypothetical protein
MQNVIRKVNKSFAKFLISISISLGFFIYFASQGLFNPSPPIEKVLLMGGIAIVLFVFGLTLNNK